MPKILLLKNNKCTVEHIEGGIKGFLSIPRILVRKGTCWRDWNSNSLTNKSKANTLVPTPVLDAFVKAKNNYPVLDFFTFLFSLYSLLKFQPIHSRAFLRLNVFLCLLCRWLFCFTAYEPFLDHLNHFCLVCIHGISTIFGYSIANPFLYITVLFQTIQFSMNTKFKCQKQFYSKQFSSS